jgi:hypothetical protein
VRLHHAKETLEVLGLVILELVAATSDRACGRRGPQQGDLRARLGAEVDQLLAEQPLDSVPGGVQP